MQITVNVFKPAGRPFYQATWKDPDTEKMRWKSTGEVSKRDAERFAGRLEKELREGFEAGAQRPKWADFRLRYEQEILAGLALTTELKAGTIFDTLEAVVSPTYVDQVNEKAIGRLVKALRDRGRSESTIEGYQARIKAALRWAKDHKIIARVPTIKKPKRAKSSKVMKGRPITLEEFERMLTKVPNVVGDDRAESWRFYLRGLWVSGLRLGESLELWWDRDDRLSLDFSGKYPMLRITAEAEKGHKDRLLPIVPEFAEFLEAIPGEDREGRVFNPKPSRQHGSRMRTDSVSKVVCQIGKAANVVVQTVEGKVKYASAHDLRRAFGERWAMKVMPTVLMVLMRHESIDTTMRYYVGRNAETVADSVWSAASTSTSVSTRQTAEKAGDTSLDRTRV